MVHFVLSSYLVLVFVSKFILDINILWHNYVYSSFWPCRLCTSLNFIVLGLVNKPIWFSTSQILIYWVLTSTVFQLHKSLGFYMFVEAVQTSQQEHKPIKFCLTSLIKVYLNILNITPYLNSLQLDLSVVVLHTFTLIKVSSSLSHLLTAKFLLVIKNLLIR